MVTNFARLFAGIALACLVGQCPAQTEVPLGEAPLGVAAPTVTRPTTHLEAYASRHHLSDGFGLWRETGLRGNYAAGPHLFQAELAAMRRFNQSGTFAAVGDTWTIDPDWYVSLSAGAGDGAVYLPRYRIDSFLNRKLLSDRNLVATVGLAYYRAPDGHIDRSVGLGAIYYFTQPLVVQGEVRFNGSDPGSVHTRRQFVAATWGRGKTQVIGRYGWGAEGYQSIAAGTVLVDFHSREASIAVRHWMDPEWGVSASVEGYRNPFYQRTGAAVGLFWQLP